MAKKSLLSGVQAKGSDRIQFDFEFAGARYRPTLKRVPTEADLRRAYKQLTDIKRRIDQGIFNFEEEFPDYPIREARSVIDEDERFAVAATPAPDVPLAQSVPRFSIRVSWCKSRALLQQTERASSC
jgi:hypothetical protein